MNNHERRKFKTDLGLNSTVTRDVVKTEEAKRANEQLSDIGLDLNPVKGALLYKGSMAVHIYESEGLEQLFFITQADGLIAHGCKELAASAATQELVKRVAEKYGQKIGKLRSGF